MKKAFMLVGLILCATAGFAAESHTDLASEGKKRNEEAYERMLEHTGWKNEKLSRSQKSTSEDVGKNSASQSPSKSS